MIEVLALPEWDAPPTSLEAWAGQLEGQGFEVVVTRESASVSWLELNELRMRGYVLLEGQKVEAINFELAAPDPSRGLEALAVAAATLRWELHDDEGDDDEDHEN